MSLRSRGHEERHDPDVSASRGDAGAVIDDDGSAMLAAEVFLAAGIVHIEVRLETGATCLSVDEKGASNSALLSPRIAGSRNPLKTKELLHRAKRDLDLTTLLVIILVALRADPRASAY